MGVPDGPLALDLELAAILRLTPHLDGKHVAWAQVRGDLLEPSPLCISLLPPKRNREIKEEG